MKIVGLVTEYNPFHNGHLYHLEKAKEISGADAAVAIMSGNFVQRGFPAICDKYARTRAAINCGVDAVFELPTYYATSSAESFAKGAVDILAGLGTDAIVYGCEDEGADFKSLAQILCDEPKEYKINLKKYLAQGMNFAAARQKAVADIDKDLAGLLSSPNNILGIEYEKAIIKGGYNISTHQILRNDEGYHKSASNIRKALKEKENVDSLIPKASLENIKYCCDIEDFSELVFFKLSELSREDLEDFYEVTGEIATRIKKYEKEAGSNIEKLVDLVSARNITYASVRRALLHVLLGIKKKDLQPCYARLLGFNKDCGVMSKIKDRARINIVNKYADAESDFVRIDAHASEVYNQVIKKAYNINIPDEYHAGVIIF